MTALILASTSATRKQMLENAGLVFDAMAPMVDEEALKAGFLAEGADARSLSDALAEAKAIKLSARNPTALVIGADQVLSLDDNILLDKAPTPEAAREQLRLLSGKSHKLFSAVVVAAAGIPVWRHVGVARMVVRPLSDEFIARYVDQQWDDIRYSVGCYQLEGLGAQLFAKIDGDFFDILGMPLLPLLAFLRERQVLPS